MKKIEINLNDLWEILSEYIKDQQKDKPEGMASLGEKLFNQYYRERSKREDLDICIKCGKTFWDAPLGYICLRCGALNSMET